MSYLNIKYFPADFSFYIFTIFINLFFVLIFTTNTFWITKELNKKLSDSKILLIIPKSLNDSEEEKDLIFNQLSLEDQIISVEIEDSKKVKVSIEKILENTNIDDAIIPEVYNLIVKSKKKINLESLNKKISKIIFSARVFSTYDNSRGYLKKPYTLMYFLIIIYLITNYFLINNIFYKIKNYLTLSRALGIKDLNIFKNLNIGFFLIIFITFIMCYIIFFLFMNEEKYNFLIFDKDLNLYLSICFLYYISFLINFNVQLYVLLKKLL